MMASKVCIILIFSYLGPNSESSSPENIALFITCYFLFRIYSIDVSRETIFFKTMLAIKYSEV